MTVLPISDPNLDESREEDDSNVSGESSSYKPGENEFLTYLTHLSSRPAIRLKLKKVSSEDGETSGDSGSRVLRSGHKLNNSVPIYRIATSTDNNANDDPKFTLNDDGDVEEDDVSFADSVSESQQEREEFKYSLLEPPLLNAF